MDEYDLSNAIAKRLDATLAPLNDMHDLVTSGYFLARLILAGNANPEAITKLAKELIEEGEQFVKRHGEKPPKA